MHRWILILLVASAATAQPSGRCDWGERSEALVSPDGRRAVHVATVAAEGDDGTPCCRVEDRLIREHAGTARVGSVPASPRTGWFADLIDWSPDGTRLLIREQEVICESDSADSRVALWDDASETFQTFDPAPIVRKHRAVGDCWIEILPVGFLADGRVVISSSQSPQIDGDGCSAETMMNDLRWWSWDPKSGDVAQLEKRVSVRRYATIRRPMTPSSR